MKSKCLGILFVVFALCPLCLCGETSSLEARLGSLVKAHEGKVAIGVKHLGSGDTYALNADEPMPTASLIKFPVMVETYFQYADGKVRPNDLITLNQADKVPG